MRGEEERFAARGKGRGKRRERETNRGGEDGFGRLRYLIHTKPSLPLFSSLHRH